ncbi:MAG: hypothetical protein J6Y78_04625 [Paludibacteraceae bacterium]|nr:hypothetical protein [Paludibacteraceae bacterium]
MASIVLENDNKFPKSRILKTPFLSSIRDFKPDGLKVGIERVSRLFPVKQEEGKAQMMVELVPLEDMEKCRVAVLDDDGEYVMVKDELTGKDQKKLEIAEIKESDVELFPIFFPCGKPEEITNEADLIFYPTSSAYPLFKFALQNAGELPKKMETKPFKTNQVELKEALEGLIFIAKCEEIKGKFNYMRLDVEPAEL